MGYQRRHPCHQIQTHVQRANSVYPKRRFDRTEPASPPWHDDVVTCSADFSATPDRQHGAEIQRLCDAMEAADQAGRYRS